MAEFLAGKMTRAMVSLALVGLAISFGSTVQMQGERQDLGSVARAIFHSIETVDSLPGEVNLIRGLPSISSDFRVLASGSWSGKTQLLNLTVESAEGRTSGAMTVNCPVNGGDFSATHMNPARIRVIKNGEMLLELL
ncbi:MAG: hypothetical protein AB1305_06055 [Candidatus Hadarchaeota archaeon]